LNSLRAGIDSSPLLLHEHHDLSELECISDSKQE